MDQLNQPAFPTTHYFDEKPVDQHYGMSLRDWFAGQVLMGLCANPHSNPMTVDSAIGACYRAADLMLKERQK
jgi:hypothetical protein